MKLRLTIAVAALALLPGCGIPGAPLPPSLELPRPVADLHAVRQGDRVTLAWTPPRLTTDGTAIRHPGPTRICAQAGPQPMQECSQPVAELQAAQIPASTAAGYVATIPPQLPGEQPLGTIRYAVEVLNARGRSAGLSNQVEVPLAPALAPPQKVAAELRPEAIAVTWPALTAPQIPGLEFALRIYRGVQDGPPPVVAGEAPATATEFLDRNFDWEKRYLYRVVPVTRVAAKGGTTVVEGDSSPPVEVFAHDVFPPAVPTGVEAVYTPGAPGFIDLTWAPDSSADFAGYNLYRRQPGAEPVKINSELVKAPAFRDAHVSPGNTYFYSVSAVDLRGNESARSAEASESVPK